MLWPSYNAVWFDLEEIKAFSDVIEGQITWDLNHGVRQDERPPSHGVSISTLINFAIFLFVSRVRRSGSCTRDWLGKFTFEWRVRTRTILACNRWIRSKTQSYRAWKRPFRDFRSFWWIVLNFRGLARLSQTDWVTTSSVRGRYQNNIAGTRKSWQVPKQHARCQNNKAGTTTIWQVPKQPTWQVPKQHGRY